MMDYYQEDRSRLNGQPKKTIADYVENGLILVVLKTYMFIFRLLLMVEGLFLRI